MAAGVTSDGQPYDLGEYRYVVAAYIKYLIRARRIDEPDFLSDDELSRWGLEAGVPEILEKADLLWRAKQIISEEINHRFIPRCGSGGIQVNESELNSVVAFFADHLHDLPEAVRRARGEEPVDWSELARWEDLDFLRNELDQLPHPGTRVEIHGITPDIDHTDLAILRTIAKANKAVAQEDLAAAACLTRKSTWQRLANLRRQGFTIKGGRGELLTDDGLELVIAHDTKTTQ